MYRHDINDEIWKKININLPGSVVVLVEKTVIINGSLVLSSGF